MEHQGFTPEDGARAAAFVESQRDLTAGRPCVCGGTGWIEMTCPVTKDGRVQRETIGRHECAACRRE